MVLSPHGNQRKYPVSQMQWAPKGNANAGRKGNAKWVRGGGRCGVTGVRTAGRRKVAEAELQVGNYQQNWVRPGPELPPEPVGPAGGGKGACGVGVKVLV